MMRQIYFQSSYLWQHNVMLIYFETLLIRQRMISSSSYQKSWRVSHMHVIWQVIENALRKYCIFISNKARNATVTTRLQEVVLQVALPILSKQHPLVYLKIEKQVLSADKGVLKMDEFHSITNNCGFSASIESKQFMGVLEYFHHRGTILHFPSIKSLQNLIIVSAHWLTSY